MTCPVCEDRGGCAGEGKETQHSFEELDHLDGNNHCGRKTRLKITTDCSDTVEGYNSSTVSCFMLILGQTKQTWTPYLPLQWADKGSVYPCLSNEMYLAKHSKI